MLAVRSVPVACVVLLPLEPLRSWYAGLEELEARLCDRRNQRDAALASLWDKVRGMRCGVEAT